MLKFSGFNFRKPALLSVAILGLALIAVEASGQTETEKVEENTPKIIDRVLLEENSLNQDNQSSPNITSKLASTLNKSSVVVKRDLPAGGVSIEKEVKKNESPSTLSFNIFLYIVDKFKED